MKKLIILNSAMLIMVLLVGCAQTRSTLTPEKSTILFNATYEELTNYIKNNSNDFGMKFVKEESHGIFIFSVFSMRNILTGSVLNVVSGGDKVTVHVTEKASDITAIQVSSYGKGQIGTDFGRNNKNVKKVLDSLEKKFRLINE